MRQRFHIPASTRLVSAKPALDWDRYLAEAREQKEKREAQAVENEKQEEPNQ